jgi:hypothetical protein
MSKPKDRTQQRTQKAGAYAALAVAGAFVLVIAYFVIFGGSRPSPASPPSDLRRPGDLAAVPLGQGGQSIGPATDARFDLTDKRDPTKTIGLVTFDAMDPLEGHRYAVRKPQAWRFLDRGRTLYIRADDGQIAASEGQREPESGTIRGNVRIKLFEEGFEVGKSDPDSFPSLMDIRTDSLSFETAIGQLTTPDPFTVTWFGGNFTGEGLSLVFNQPQQRLERGEVLRKGKLTMTGERRRASGQGSSSTASTATPADPAAPPDGSTQNAPAAPSKPAPIETIYRLVGSGNVVASQTTRRLTADTFQVLARLIDNGLPENAIRDIQFAQDEPAPSAAASASAAPTSGVAPTAPAVAGTTPGTPAPAREPLVLAWDGPCIIVPLAQTPTELARDHVAARFAANEGGRVNLSDDAAGLSGFARSIEYGATSGSLAFVGADSDKVSLASAQSGRIETTRIDADLVSGIVTTPGAGTLTDGRENAQTISWSQRGRFNFLITDMGLTSFLREALVEGDVAGSGRGFTFSSAAAGAGFVKSAAGKPEVSWIDLAGNARAASTETGSMTGGKLHIDFDPPTATITNPRPRFVRAEDGFTVERDGQFLAGHYLESRLLDLPEGKVDVGSVLARGDVRFKSEADFIEGQTQELTADLGFDETGHRKQLIWLVGDGTTIARNQPGVEQGAITSTQLAIDGVLGRLDAFGAGDFNYRGLSGSDEATIDAIWTRRMTYDDAAGLIDCWGSPTVRYSPDADTRNKADADRVKLFISPGTPGRSILAARPGKPSDAPNGAPPAERSILAAELFGSILDREGGVNARIESRSYAAGSLQKLSYLEGPSILANNDKGTLDVPGSGKFLLLDQSAAASTPAPGTRDLGGDARGTSLFTWTTSLHAAKQPTGDTVMKMVDGVNVIHRALKDGQVTEIRCDGITADFKNQDASLGDAGRGLELHTAVATGSVYAASGPPRTPQQPRPPVRELIADTLTYDALARRIEARANPGGIVTMFDPATASPTTAAWLTWDLEKNTVQVRQPAGVSPR